MPQSFSGVDVLAATSTAHARPISLAYLAIAALVAKVANIYPLVASPPLLVVGGSTKFSLESKSHPDRNVLYIYYILFLRQLLSYLPDLSALICHLTLIPDETDF